MSDELTPQAGADEATGQEPAAPTDKTASELERARREAANYRTKLRELEAKWKEAEPVLTQFQQQQEAQKGDAQKALDHAADLERKLAEKEAAIVRAEREAAVTRLAVKAGLDLDLVPYLDLSKLDLDDEKAALEVLGKLTAARQPGSASNPGRGGPAPESDDERRSRLITGRGARTTMFGG